VTTESLEGHNLHLTAWFSDDNPARIPL
jgi:hypothetical protein